MQTSFKLIVAAFAAPAILAGAALAVTRQSDAPSASRSDATVIAVSPTSLVTVAAASTDPAAPAPTQVTIVNLAPATATATAVPGDPAPAADEPAASELPRVLSMRTDHAGPGAVILRFSSNVATSAEVRVMSNQAGEAFSWSSALPGVATEHEIAIPANFGRYVVIIEDEMGNEARGTLRYGSDPQGIDFDNDEFAPELKAQSAKKLLVSRGFASDHPAKPGEPGQVLVYSKDAGCVTADGCIGGLIGPAIDSAVETNPEADYHTALAVIPGSAFDYQVVIAHSQNEIGTQSAFVQLEIRRDRFPKTNFAGPSTLTR